MPKPFLDPALVHSPFLAQLHPQLSTLALSLALRACLGSSAAARHGLAPVLRSSSSPRRVHWLGKLLLITHNPRCSLVRPLPLWFAWSALTRAFLAEPESHHRRPKLSSCPCRRSRVPESLLMVTDSPVRRGLPLHRPSASPPFLLSRPRHRIRRVLPILSCNPDRPLAP
jgi:hypothetical protein